MKTPKTRNWLYIAAIILTFFALSCEKEDPVEPPTLTTAEVTEITGNSATSGGSVTDDGGATIIVRGVVWDQSENPTVNEKEGSTIDGIGSGEFTSSMAGLSPGTTYFVRAYAVNSAGTTYGNQVQFTTNELASVTTAEVTDITSNSAACGGNVTSDGGTDVTARGIVWGVFENPTVDNHAGKTSDGSGTGEFASNLTELSPGTKYYVRAYATNNEGVSYGNQVEFTTDARLAIVTTKEVTDIKYYTAKSGGVVIDDGGEEVTARGIVWSIFENPTVDNHDGKTSDGFGTGIFTSNLSGLDPGTTFYVRAYATNKTGTAYGDEKSFNTPVDGLPCPDITTFTDPRDGKVYSTVQIGGQCWLKENLRYLPAVSPVSAGSLTDPHYYVYGYQGTSIFEAKATAFYQNYGVLYNWPAAMNGASGSAANPSGVKGVCPAGWHLPSDGELAQLVNYLMDEYDLTNNAGDVNGVGNKLKSCRQVDSPLGGDCATIEHPRWNSHDTHYGTDQFGFSALPAGLRQEFGYFLNIGSYSAWWSTSGSSTTHALYRSLNYHNSLVFRESYNKANGLSVRCVRDD